MSALFNASLSSVLAINGEPAKALAKAKAAMAMFFIELGSHFAYHAFAAILGATTAGYVNPQEFRLVHLAAQAARCSGRVHSGRLPIPGSRGIQCAESDCSEA